MLATHLERFHEVHVLCIGDIMLDRYISGAVNRISPESPVPILSVSSSQSFPGGAANVALNIASLGGRCTLIGLVGDDEGAADLNQLLQAEGRIRPVFVASPQRPTTEKVRFIAHGQQILRTDVEISTPVDDFLSDCLLVEIEKHLHGKNVIVLSDYAKGVLSKPLISQVISWCNAANIPVIVDPKNSDFSRYNGATLITPNTKEAEAAAGHTIADDADVSEAGQILLAKTEINAILITRAERGMSLITRNNQPSHIPTTAREVTDVVGAGDTVISSLALAIGAGAPMQVAASIANAAAGIVVAKRGTAKVSPAELRNALLVAEGDQSSPNNTKVMSERLMREQTHAWRREGLKVGFTNGCFDILHVGHLGILSFSRANCDRLIVAINSDASVKKLKGPERPINSEADRAQLLAALSVVHAVVVFNEDTPERLINELMPDVLVKGQDYHLDQIVGASIVVANGGKVLQYELVPGKSTTRSIEKIRGSSLSTSD